MLYEVITHVIDAHAEDVDRDALGEVGRATAPVNTDRHVGIHVRITSYNVCYTKLLRGHRVLRLQ